MKSGVPLLKVDVDRRNKMLYSIIGWLVKMSANETVQLVIKRLLPLLMTYIKDLIPFIIAEIKKAAADPNLSAAQKFDAVIDAAVSTFPGVATSVIRMFVELFYTLIVKPEELEKPSA